jgi:RHS repeat-associated protein
VPLGFTEYASLDAAPESGRTYTVFSDQVGMPLHIEDEQGSIVWWADRVDPYGHIEINPTSQIEYNLRWPGHYYDPITGLHYNRRRAYDPVLGRYLQSDPIGYKGSEYNLYAYCPNPLVQVDVLGLNHNNRNRQNGDDSQEGTGHTGPVRVSSNAFRSGWERIFGNPNPSRRLNGRKIINSELADQTVNTAGGPVRFDRDGFPDFTPYSENTVRVSGLTGSMNSDIPRAMQASGLDSYDSTNFVWHHHQDGQSMMLVPRSVHSVRNGGVAHTGGRAVIQHNAANPDNQIHYNSPPLTKGANS